MKRLTAVFVLAWALLSSTASAFGPKGHGLVGQIADDVLASNPVAHARVQSRLNGLSLGAAALIADDIKDANWAMHLKPAPHWTSDSGLVKEMQDFLSANPKHKKYHYTDISIVGDLKYGPTKTGASNDDVVHMINYCIGVIQDTGTAPNPKKITKRVATILLAHYVGDIHQPLHVGAAYFDTGAKLVDADKVPGAEMDTGGNNIQFFPTAAGAGVPMHVYWDDTAVDAVIARVKKAVSGSAATGPLLTPQEVKTFFVSTPPPGSPLDSGIAIGSLAESWANEMLKIANEAHSGLKFSRFPQPYPQVTYHGSSYTFKWKAQHDASKPPYDPWAEQVIEHDIHRAGWRLANLLAALP